MPSPTLLSRPIHHTGYGLMGLTWTPTPPEIPIAIAAMKAAVDNGANFWNGGIIYGSPTYNSLHLLRAYFDKYPGDAAKIIVRRPSSRKKSTPLSILGGTKSIDIYETARVDPTLPIETVMSTLTPLKKSGKIGGIGLSECSAATINRAAKVGQIDVVEVEASLWSTEIFTNGVAAACAQHGIIVAAYSPLGKGFLTGKVVAPSEFEEGDHRKHMPRFQPGVKGLAERKGVQPSQLALAWVRAQGRKGDNPVMVPIPGSTSVERIRENLAAVELTDGEVEELDALVKEHTITGGRYPEQFAKLCFGDSVTLEEWNKKG
ncbi:hypothetical protein M409DRAFT_70802 [Zasmidium cellare ATCC 36951]|uniref:NADP-dependent oxidoreductase domain-containing protein n=1 Tax=Zasmidium cellare ATCC 36951 TaxID=1080233 RepID=A0A6A6C0E4_ZASCE|nr:uncharacterized protein M409DRAFT_70802 [Zasmidium cellare ATCC 36951]KAF2159738.1 hypothetical protein M409DRAFT_70802 [Zasmidium cellare ATCC 36951]